MLRPSQLALAAGLLLAAGLTGLLWYTLGEPAPGREPLGEGGLGVEATASRTTSERAAPPAFAEGARTALPGPDSARLRKPSPENLAAQGLVEGSVVDTLGTAIPDCEVVVAALEAERAGLPRADEPLASRPDSRGVLALSSPGSTVRTRTGPDGRFRLEVRCGVPLAALIAHREFPLRVAAYGFVLRADETRSLGTLVLHTVPGLQVDVFAGGAPVVGARLELSPALADLDLPRAATPLLERLATSDEKGRAVFYGLLPRLYHLRLEAPGCASVLVDHEHAPRGDRSVELRIDLEPGAVLRGKVIGPGGTPLAEATVIARSLRSRAWQRVQSGEDGAFRIPGLATGTTLVWAETAEYGPTPRQETELASAGVDLVLAYAKAFVIEGDVVAEQDGRPVPDARVRIVRRHQDGNEHVLVRPEVRADASGHFRADAMPPGEYVIAVNAHGFAPGEFLIAHRGPPFTPSRCALATSSACSGRVLDQNGRPLADVSVEAVAADDDGSTFATWVQRATPSAQRPTARSDSEGRFLLDGLRAGNLRLRFRREGHPDLRSPRITLAPGALKDLGTLSMQLGGRVRGTTYAEDRRPAAGALVSAEPVPLQNESEVASAREARHAIADGEGRYDLGLLGPGRYEITFRLGPRETLAEAVNTATRTKVYVQVTPGADLVQDLHRTHR